MATKEKVARSPLVMLVAAVIWLAGAVMTVIGIMNFGHFGWWALLLMAIGITSVFLASATIVTGKPEWIMIDLILPG